jgi:hypothetical protein
VSIGRPRPWTVFVAALAVICAVNFLILIGAMRQLSAQAKNGERARQTQCDREPVIQKLGQAGYAVRDSLPAHSRITAGELERFLEQAPKC